MNNVNATIDLEPVHTYRGHTCGVLSLCINGNKFFSGSQDGQIILWQIPANIMNIDPYDAYEPKLQISNTQAHGDAVWSLATLTSATNSLLLCSGSADGTIKIWDIKSGAEFSCIKTIEFESMFVCVCVACMCSVINVVCLQMASSLRICLWWARPMPTTPSARHRC